MPFGILFSDVQYKLYDALLGMDSIKFKINLNLGQAGFEPMTELSPLILEIYETAALPLNHPTQIIFFINTIIKT